MNESPVETSQEESQVESSQEESQVGRQEENQKQWKIRSRLLVFLQIVAEVANYFCSTTASR
jgi:hypothetical protein